MTTSEDKKRGYFAAISSTFMGLIFTYSGATSPTSTMMIMLGAFFIILGIVSFIKPETIGAVLYEWFKNTSKNYEQSERFQNKHLNKQVQKNMLQGTQIIAKNSNIIIPQTVNVDMKEKNKKNEK